MRVANPFRPGFNQAPDVMAGRDSLLADAREALEIAALDQRTPRPLVLVGSRGVGKTVTLGEVATLAGHEFAWPQVHVEVRASSFISELIARLTETTRLLAGEAPRPKSSRRRVRVAGGKVTAAAFGVGGEVALENLESSLEIDQQLEATLSYAMQVAMERNAGLVLTLDEVHTASIEELGILSACLQEHVPNAWPLVVLLAGLPSLRNNRGKRKLPTYLERAEWHELGHLTDTDAERALAEPARRAGRPMTPEAVQALLQICGGYPYAIQVAGHFTWRASHGEDQISGEHVAAARPRIQTDLDQLHAGRWADASVREREYLLAVAAVTAVQPPTGGLVAAQLGKETTEVSYLRERLIKKGTLYADAAGVLHFITPGMSEWITRTQPSVT